MTPPNDGFSDKIQKSFDFASDLVKQEITIASAVLVLMVAVVKVAFSELETIDYIFLGISWTFLFLSIGTGFLSLMGLTFQLSTTNPSIENKGVRSPAITQATLFLFGLLFTLLFGFSAAWAEETETNPIPIKENEVVSLLPKELQKDKYALDFVKIITAWNNGSIDLPNKKTIDKHFNNKLQFASANMPFGYENDEWINRRKIQFQAFPDKLKPQIPFNKDAIQTMLWVYSINLPVIKSQAKTENRLKENPLPFFLLFGQAQMIAKEAGTENITAQQVINATFTWWTNVWPFCISPRQ